MKRCPECRRDYSDDTLLYCLEYGAALVQGTVPSPDKPQTANFLSTDIASEAPMKRCPECRRDYYDDSLLYCLDEGSALLEGPATAESPTAILSGDYDAATRSFDPQVSKLELSGCGSFISDVVLLCDFR